MSTQPMKCMLEMLQDLEHHIRTSYGTLESFMHNNSLIPFQGIFQVNRAGPTILVIVSAPVVEMMQGAGLGIKFEPLLS